MTAIAPPSLTTTERAIIDFERQKEALMARAKNFNPDTTTREPGDTILRPDVVDALTRPVRVEIDFRDPIHVRQQIDVLLAALIEAKVITQEHSMGINRQRIRLREVLKSMADTLTMINGKTPAGRRRRVMADLQAKQNTQTE